MKIIGITGTLGAGKGAIVTYLKTKGFNHYSARTFIIEEAKKRNRLINRDMTTLTADELRKENGADFIIRSLLKQAREKNTDAVIESVRATGELDFLRTQPNFYLISIDADPKLRYKRIIKRGSETDHISYKKFLSDEEREMHNSDPNKGNIAEMMERADFSIMNNTSLTDLHQQVDTLLAKIENN